MHRIIMVAWKGRLGIKGRATDRETQSGMDHHRKLYVYHIITKADISELIKICNTYPLVHFKNETCEQQCKSKLQQEDDEGNRGGNSKNDDPTSVAAEGRGDIPDSELGQGEERRNPKLCPGPDGIIEFEGESEYRIRWGNGRRRRYSVGGGSRGGICNDDGEVGEGVCTVGAYAAGGNRVIEKLYEGPYKLIAAHYGNRGFHWHLIYISYNKQWGFNSRLGRTIRKSAYKNKSVDCLHCLRKYIYSGNGRQVLQDILSEEHIEVSRCAEHYCGVDSENSWKREAYEADCAEGGNTIFRTQSTTFEAGHDGVVDAVVEADDGVAGKSEYKVCSKKRKVLDGFKDGANEYDSRKDIQVDSRNTNIILVLCERGAFTETEAMGVFAKSPEGINLMCSKQYNEKIRNWIHIARVLVFQESLKQRFERAKKKFEEDNDMSLQEETIQMFKEILKMNKISEEEFFRQTFAHFTQMSKKKNNLFFYGPPSTGKTMIMNSLVECHFNFSRLTGLISNSSFNFSGLIHTNACFMDECKLTDNQFEQWKLLASGLPMSTDVKYKDRCDVKGVVLYTCSNYPIEMYCNVPMANEAVNSRTIKFELKQKCPWFIKIAPHSWEKCWGEYDLVI